LVRIGDHDLEPVQARPTHISGYLSLDDEPTGSRAAHRRQQPTRSQPDVCQRSSPRRDQEPIGRQEKVAAGAVSTTLLHTRDAGGPIDHHAQADASRQVDDLIRRNLAKNPQPLPPPMGLQGRSNDGECHEHSDEGLRHIVSSPQSDTPVF
jgi:hypothetical protein